jgi:hypothetical protein
MRRVSAAIALIGLIVTMFAAGACAAPEIYIKGLQVVPQSITAGQAASLQWNVSGATSVTISGLGEQTAFGNLSVQPAQTTTYTLIAKNAGRSVQSSVTLTVSPAPVNTPLPPPQPPIVSALDTQALLDHIGDTVRVQGDVTYVSSWLPTRFRGMGMSGPWTFMFFMKDVWEGAANNAGGGEYCPDCWRDYTSQFRVIITPGNLPALLPVLNSYFGGGFSLQEQGLIIGATGAGRLIFLPSPFWNYGYVAQTPVHVTVQGAVVNYLSAPAIYLTQPGQLSFGQ